MDILVLGGTRFLGRAVVQAARARGHRVTLLNRGRTDPDLFPDLDTIRVDRTAPWPDLRGRRWDVAVDVAGYDPEVVRRSAEGLLGSIDRYVFVSTVSVYADHSVSQVEGQPVLVLRPDTPPEQLYGARKAAAEGVVTEVYGERALVVRPGLIVGPHDATDRFAYWPRRVARGGAVLAPGNPFDPAQFIDVRDLAEWILAAATAGCSGAYNVTGQQTTIGELLLACLSTVPAGTASLVWVDSGWLLDAGVDPWMGVPLWIAAPGWEAASQVDIGKAVAAGLTHRPMLDTVRDTLAWDVARGGFPAGPAGLAADQEAVLLARYEDHLRRRRAAADAAEGADVSPPAVIGTEAQTLASFLQYLRTSLIGKLDGLDAGSARRLGVDSGVTLLWLVKHVATVEMFWLHHAFAASPPDTLVDDELTESDSPESVIALYRAVAATSAELLAGDPDLDQAAAIAPFGPPVRNLRWILVHLIEETARHAGHADILRERIDGVTGR